MSSLAHRHSAPATLDTRRIQGLAAIVAGPLFFAIVAVLTRVELDFMHRLGWRFTGDDDVPWPSGLALGGAGAVQGANFALAGILLALFTRGFRRELSASRLGRLAALLIAAIAGAFALSAIPTDHATAATGSPDTWHGYIHGIAFIVLVVASLAAPLATAVALRGNPRWRRFPALSLAVVVLELALSVGLGSLGDPVFAAWLAVVFGWFAALGAHLRRLQEADPLR
jgi:hypothetical protein